MQIEDINNSFAQEAPSYVVITEKEAETIVAKLKSFELEDIGGTEFLELYGYDFEKLALQAHASTQEGEIDNTDHEYILDLILRHDKMKVLVKTLVMMEIWRCQILKNRRSDSSLKEYISQKNHVIRCAFTLHVEVRLISFFSLLMYEKKACEEMENDVAIALIDYCARNFALLAIPIDENLVVKHQKNPLNILTLANTIEKKSSLEELEDIILNTEYKAAISAVVVARYFCEHIEHLSLALQSRILDTHDFLIMTIPLICEPPWTRRRQAENKFFRNNSKVQGKIIWEKYINGEWKKVEPVELLRITNCEAQCWIIIFFLTCSNCCRERYRLNSHRKGQLLRLRKFFNEVIIDQLPILTDVVQYMDQLTIMDVSYFGVPNSISILIHEVPMMRERILKDKDWNRIINKQISHTFSRVGCDAQDGILKKISSLYEIDGLENILTASNGIKKQCLPSSFCTIIYLHIRYDDEKSVALKLKSLENTSTIIQTQKGPFRRNKMSIIQQSESCSLD